MYDVELRRFVAYTRWTVKTPNRPSRSMKTLCICDCAFRRQLLSREWTVVTSSSLEVDAILNKMSATFGSLERLLSVLNPREQICYFNKIMWQFMKITVYNL